MDILGNYFGVKPDGATQAANGKNVEITDTIAFKANNDQVGTTVEGAAATTQACDGGCNVVSGSTAPRSTWSATAKARTSCRRAGRRR